jgi:hypothetical protein
MLSVIYAECHKFALVIMLNVIMLNVIMLNVIMLNVIMLNDIILSVIKISVVAPTEQPQKSSWTNTFLQEQNGMTRNKTKDNEITHIYVMQKWAYIRRLLEVNWS